MATGSCTETSSLTPGFEIQAMGVNDFQFSVWLRIEGFQIGLDHPAPSIVQSDTPSQAKRAGQGLDSDVQHLADFRNEYF